LCPDNRPIEEPAMNASIHLRPLLRGQRLWQGLAGGASALALLTAGAPAQAALTFGNAPLYLVVGKANVLITLDNSNSMDEDPAGTAVGSANSASKSEIARGVIRSLTDTYLNRVNMGLMAYRQNATSAGYLHNSQYDLSYDPTSYDSAWTGARASATHKRYRIANPTSAGNYLHYNVALPFYDTNSQGNAFCYSLTSNPFNNGEPNASLPNNGWDTYRCFTTKTGTENTLPTTQGNTGQETAKGYSGAIGSYTFTPTDSDYAQGITDFGQRMAWQVVSRTWFRNDSPGRGYLHVPLGLLNSTQATTIKNKLACNIPGLPTGCTNGGLQNAGLTPIEGTLLTAKDYFGGSWNVASEGYTSSCYPLPTSCGKNFVVLLTDGLPSTDKNGTTVSDPATALTAAAAAAATLKTAGIETYVIGFALPYGTDPRSLDQIAIAGGTDKAYDASSTTSLQEAFNQIFDDIFRKSSAFGSISQNSTAVTTTSRIFQGRFDSTDWSGEMVALNASASPMTTVWSTHDTGRIPAAASRKVFTYKPGTGGVAFKTLGDLTTTQQSNLTSVACSTTLTGNSCGQARIDWLRGDQSQETTTGPFRRRSHILGDIISSSPNYVSTTSTIFVGANDGMLHAFDSTTGNERFAFVPNAVFPDLYKLTDPNYSHLYYVDGEIVVSSKYETPNKNILVGALGRGGKALYALDVTSPSTFDATKVLWEFTDSDLGLTFGKPFIAKMNNGKTAVVIGNGYNSTNERAVLFVIDIDTGAVIRKIDTMAGSSTSSNGLAQPGGYDADGNGTVDTIYAGDRLGNLWKFDVSSGSASSWGPSFGTSSAPEPMFVAYDSSGTKRQPITGGLGFAINPKKTDPNYGKVYVFFGTGQYLVSTDPSDLSVQSWYGLVDNNAKITGRSELKQRSIVAEGTSGGTSVRAFSQATANDMSGKKGWYLDWVPVSGVAAGERVVSDSKYIEPALMVTSIIPSTNTCVPGGTSYVNAIDPFSGASLSSPFIDANGDGVFNDSDTLTVGTVKVPVGSYDPGNNLASEPIVLGTTNASTSTGKSVVNGTDGTTKSRNINMPVRQGRIAWREIVRRP
jgi:type IV pilus assembly protein PilY1